VKIVCDTNILISAYLFPGGSPEEVVNRVRTKDVTLCLSPDILTEFKKVLVLKFKHTGQEADERVQRLTQISEMVYPKERLDLIKRKESDNRILECAVECGADFLVTGDKRDILPLKTVGKTRILTASQFLELMKDL
jgi:putative PIN family toxin of toxin-antitoxin system